MATCTVCTIDIAGQTTANHEDVYITLFINLCRIVAVGNRAFQCYVSNSAKVNHFDDLVPDAHIVSSVHTHIIRRYDSVQQVETILTYI